MTNRERIVMKLRVVLGYKPNSSYQERRVREHISTIAAEHSN